MKKIVVLLAVALFALTASAQTRQEEHPSYVETTGIAEMEIAPNEFYLSITINERDSKGKISVEEQLRQMTAILKKLGVNIDTQLKVENMSSEFFKKNNSLSSAQYQLKLTTPEMVTNVYSALDNMGISDIRTSKITNSQIDAYKQHIRIEAIRNAKSNAETLAKAIGQSLGECFYIYDSNNSYGASMYEYSMDLSLRAPKNNAAEIPAEPIDFKNIKLKYNVQAKFVLNYK